jgi:hypothetical protein
MKRSLGRDLALVVVTGVVAPYALLAGWGSVHAAIRGPSTRIAALLTPSLYRPRQNLGVLVVDAALGMAIGAVLAAVIARFTHTRRWGLWMVFVAAFLTTALVVPGSEGIATRLGVLARQPMIMFVLCGASLGFWLGPRRGEPRGAR